MTAVDIIKWTWTIFAKWTTNGLRTHAITGVAWLFAVQIISAACFVTNGNTHLW